MGGVAIAGARVLLTGATGGLGGALARRLHAGGAVLTLTGRRAEVLETLAEQLGARAIRADLAERDDVERLLVQAGEVDVLIANAALPGSGRLSSLDQVAIDRALEVNLRAPAALARALVPAMAGRRRGQLVFVGSLSGRAASAGASVYCATKFGLRGLALSLRAELAASGVGVTLVEPGFIGEAGMYGDTDIKLPRGVGTRRPEDVADAVLRAIERNRGVVTVATPGLGTGSHLAGIVPDFAAWATRRMGAEDLTAQFEEQQAAKR
jgi:short-subunit dehydrogenase